MAKRRKKSSKCPEPFNTLIDLAAAATLNYIGYKRRQKRGSKKKNKIDPYAAAGIAMGMGKLNSTEDVIRLGGFLGAMGAFDDDNDTNDYSTYTPSRASSCRVYQTSTYKPSNKNRYAWRMNCENGSAYGIYPEHYETRDEYNIALKKAKFNEPDEQPQIDITTNKPPKPEPKHKITCSEIVVCKISSLDTGKTYYCRTNGFSVKVGDVVMVETDNDAKQKGVVILIEQSNQVLSEDEINSFPVIIDITKK